MRGTPGRLASRLGLLNGGVKTDSALHSALGYLSPAEYEKMLTEDNLQTVAV